MPWKKEFTNPYKPLSEYSLADLIKLRETWYREAGRTDIKNCIVDILNGTTKKVLEWSFRTPRTTAVILTNSSEEPTEPCLNVQVGDSVVYDTVSATFVPGDWYDYLFTERAKVLDFRKQALLKRLTPEDNVGGFR